jgi:hypothetical protein
MMFGFGDVWPPKEDSVVLMETLAVNYIKGITREALQV